MAEQQEQNRSEEPTPFKLKRARERGMVARSTELGFLAGLITLIAFILVAGDAAMARLAAMMRRALAAGIDQAAEPQQLPALIASVYWSAAAPVLLIAATAVGIVLLFDLLQLRGFILSAHPLKPDFGRLNPAKGLKRLFSWRMLIETLKSIAKAAAYGIATYLAIRHAVANYAELAGDGDRLAEAMRLAALRLLYWFLLITIAFAALDQLLVRREYLKQMRMSRREITRESKDREGDPRIKQKRKQLHAEFVKASRSAGALPGADLLVVNPEHFAVALFYDRETMAAPQIMAKGRNRFALQMKDEAFRRNMPIIRAPELARALYRQATIGDEVPPQFYAAVADLYIDLYRNQAQQAS